MLDHDYVVLINISLILTLIFLSACNKSLSLHLSYLPHKVRTLIVFWKADRVLKLWTGLYRLRASVFSVSAPPCLSEELGSSAVTSGADAPLTPEVSTTSSACVTHQASG